MTTTSRPFIPRSVVPSFPIRMIALDIDGTLVDEDLILPDRTVAAIRRATRRGIHVSLVTGRMTSSAIRFAETLGLSTPVVGYQGALIREMPGDPHRVGRMLRHRPLAPGVARSAEAWSRERGLDPHVNHLERLVIRGDDPRVDDYSAFLGTRATRVRDLGEWITRPVTKIVAVGPPGLPMGLLTDARRVFAGRAEVTVAHPRFLEFVAPRVSKGEAVRWLARRHGLDLSNALAIGDQVNDLEMLAAVGHGTSMPSAPPAVISAARYVASSLSDEGAAEIIERLALAGSREAAGASVELAGQATKLRATLPTGELPSWSAAR
ncbi:MAG: HAD family phosphatase [Chloroflexi bacterium]|nr:HAD family phosphatase [Chloroflexota bacterium]